VTGKKGGICVIAKDTGLKEKGKAESLSPEFWIEVWNSHSRRFKSEPWSACRCTETWDRMARDGARAEERGEQTAHRERVVGMLEERGALRPGAQVLDMGCGAGRWAFEFAGRGAEVVGLDFSKDMLRRMQEETPPGLEGRITAVETDWRSLDLEKENFVKAFDLVFANMTPAVNGPESFLKLMEASREWCFFGGWAGRRSEPLLEDLWRHLTGRDKTWFGSDIIIPFNLVYAMGYSPCLGLRDVRWEREMTLREAEDYFSHFLAGALGRPREEIMPGIRDYLRGKAGGGTVMRTTTGRTGFMMWRVG
jgi:SAM-dependent methyltransferase